MKRVLLPVAILCMTLTSAFADNRNGDRRDRPDSNRELRQCLIQNDFLTRENRSLTDRLLNCRSSEEDNRRIEQLSRENQDLILRNNFLMDQVEKLKIDNARLEMEAHPDRNGNFDLAQSIRACGKIDNTVYAQSCIALARQNSIRANVIEQCARVTNTYYALECVKTAGAKEVNARQIDACLGIDNSVYAQSCIEIAGSKRISADIIKSCVQSTTNTYYELECIKSM